GRTGAANFASPVSDPGAPARLQRARQERHLVRALPSAAALAGCAARRAATIPRREDLFPWLDCWSPAAPALSAPTLSTTGWRNIPPTRSWCWMRSPTPAIDTISMGWRHAVHWWL